MMHVFADVIVVWALPGVEYRSLIGSLISLRLNDLMIFR